jgi:PhnB protein
MVMHYKDSPDPKAAGGDPNRVMHASLSIGDAKLMASDGNSSEGPSFQGFGLTLNVDSEAEARRLFAALEPGGHVVMPMAKTFYSSSFGMVADQFGLLWMILTAAGQTEPKK